MGEPRVQHAWRWWLGDGGGYARVRREGGLLRIGASPCHAVTDGRPTADGGRVVITGGGRG